MKLAIILLLASTTLATAARPPSPTHTRHGIPADLVAPDAKVLPDLPAPRSMEPCARPTGIDLAQIRLPIDPAERPDSLVCRPMIPAKVIQPYPYNERTQR